ncbi:hypothetical protein L6164_024030 [Bauhinia variegata]|uniref:Uncharacterized protein n=1 Tax=Bauhinia variegata TaxID=167791 RepID=A0ACB9LYK3_BAUVA|nr:hypothetical protein L6164_024030 [Bauhinia variegata]
MSTTTSNFLIKKRLWRFVGFGSSIVGFSCYALSPLSRTFLENGTCWRSLCTAWLSLGNSDFVEAIAGDVGHKIELSCHEDGDAAVAGSNSSGQNILTTKKNV